MDTLKSYLPFSNWKQAAGLFLVIVVFIAIATKFKVQQKANKLVGA